MNGYSKLFLAVVGVMLLVGIAGIVGVTVSRSDARASGERVLTMRQAVKRVEAERIRVLLPTPTPEPPLPTPDWLAPSFAALCDQYEVMTISQRQAFAEAMVGKRIIGWTGQVYRVERWDLQRYVIKIDMRGDRFFRTRQVELLGVSRELVAQLEVGQQLRFDGAIRSIPMYAEGGCNPIYIVEASIIPQ
jgi:hypothetical protein